LQKSLQEESRALRSASVLIVGGAPEFRSRLRESLRKYVALVDSAESAGKAGQLMARCRFGYLIVNAELPDMGAQAWLEELQRNDVAARVLLVAERGKGAGLSQAMNGQLSGVLERPLDLPEVIDALQNARLPQAQAATSSRASDGAALSGQRELIGESAQMREVMDLIRRIAPLPGTVLIEGETGTGKELVARWLHALSTRRGAFVAVNCGAIAPELLESELFGHTKGAFTSAHQVREGLFVAARGGTLYLDEISEMPFSLQVKLLRVLEEGALRPVGSDQEVPVNVRVLASTQHDLPLLVRERNFREDLYFRLNVAQVNLPPLRDRLDDIPVLARHFMATLAENLGVETLLLEPRAIGRMQQYHWPGNVRELKNFIERSLMLGSLALEGLTMRAPPEDGPPQVAEYPLDWTLEEVKQHHMARVLKALDGNKSAAARQLGVSRKTLERRIRVTGEEDGA